MFKEKLDSVNELISKSLPIETTNISGHKITFSFSADKSITLDFNQDYLRDIKENDISDMINDFDLVNLIENSDYKTINISEKGAVPYLGNK
jgi:hypothetical protein